MQPTVRRSWARRGQTPTIAVEPTRAKAAVIGAIICTLLAGAVIDSDYAFELYNGSVNWEVVYEFLEALYLEHGPLLVVLDNARPHKKALRLLQEDYGEEAIEALWLPSYAPELMPIEYLWGHSKRGPLANWCPKSVDELYEGVHKTLHATDRGFTEPFLRLAGLL